jgi:outer membrane protein OmpA-like peptidoglycan-associated protein
MKNKIILFTILLILWIAGSAYCYVCNIRNDCKVVQGAVVTDMAKEKADTLSSSSVKAEIPQKLDLYFDFNGRKVLLSGEDKQRIDEFKKYITENPGSVIDITGHSDHVGSQQAKLKISTERAQFAQHQLIAAGIDSSKLNVLGKGDSEPATADNTSDGNAKNRRVEIQIK